MTYKAKARLKKITPPRVEPTMIAIVFFWLPEEPSEAIAEDCELETLEVGDDPSVAVNYSIVSITQHESPDE